MKGTPIARVLDALEDLRRVEAEWHRLRHVELHAALDELIADWALHQRRGKLFSNSTITELMQWSHRQTIEPEEIDNDGKAA